MTDTPLTDTPVDEIPVAFDCEGATLIGMVHRPAQVRGRGVLTVVAGGPQYRGGVCRMQVEMARQLAAAGMPVMRFDYRGIGDSEGEFRGFCHVEADLRAALAEFCTQVPQMRGVVLYGGCDAASASMINAWKFPQVQGLALGNPWVHSEEMETRVAVQHYGQRIFEWSFWRKLLTLQYNPLPALLSLVCSMATRVLRVIAPGSQAALPAANQDDLSLPFQTRMQFGMGQFGGDVLLLMSGRSLVSKEFDELVSAQPGWQKAMAAPRSLVRHNLPEADQAFSTTAARSEVCQVISDWILRSEAAPARTPRSRSHP